MSSESMYLYGASVACEVAFWLVLVAALVCCKREDAR
jgi:hypothetical protein